MTFHSDTAGVPHTASGWSRLLGVSLRPWSGESPASLIIRGVLQAAISIFFLVLILRLPAAGKDLATVGELQYLRGLAILASVALAVTALIGLVRLTVGILDLVPRRSVSGTIVSIRERKFGDILPYMAQRKIFERRETGLDRRKSRIEVVLETDAGPRQWTVRSFKMRRDLHLGAQVQLSVTPLTGYVARGETLTR